MLDTSGAVPVVIKSLIFPTTAGVGKDWKAERAIRHRCRDLSHVPAICASLCALHNDKAMCGKNGQPAPRGTGINSSAFSKPLKYIF